MRALESTNARSHRRRRGASESPARPDASPISIAFAEVHAYPCRIRQTNSPSSLPQRQPRIAPRFACMSCLWNLRSRRTRGRSGEPASPPARCCGSSGRSVFISATAIGAAPGSTTGRTSRGAPWTISMRSHRPPKLGGSSTSAPRPRALTPTSPTAPAMHWCSDRRAEDCRGACSSTIPPTPFAFPFGKRPAA